MKPSNLRNRSKNLETFPPRGDESQQNVNWLFSSKASHTTDARLLLMILSMCPTKILPKVEWRNSESVCSRAGLNTFVAMDPTGSTWYRKHRGTEPAAPCGGSLLVLKFQGHDREGICPLVYFLVGNKTHFFNITILYSAWFIQHCERLNAYNCFAVADNYTLSWLAGWPQPCAV